MQILPYDAVPHHGILSEALYMQKVSVDHLTCLRQLFSDTPVFSLTSSRSFLSLPVNFFPSNSLITSLSNMQQLKRHVYKLEAQLLQTTPESYPKSILINKARLIIKLQCTLCVFTTQAKNVLTLSFSQPQNIFGKVQKMSEIFNNCLICFQKALENFRKISGNQSFVIHTGEELLSRIQFHISYNFMYNCCIFQQITTKSTKNVSQSDYKDLIVQRDTVYITNDQNLTNFELTGLKVSTHFSIKSCCMSGAICSNICFSNIGGDWRKCSSMLNNRYWSLVSLMIALWEAPA